MIKYLFLVFSLITTPALAQWQVPSGAIPVGRGAGVSGFNTVAGSIGLGSKCLVDTVPPTFGACSAVNGVIYATNYGIVCDGVTSNTAAFAALTVGIGTGGKRVIFPSGTCLTGLWSLAGLSNIIVEGQGGADITETVTATAIICTQTGAATCFDFSNTRGLSVRDMTFGYNSTIYSGVIMSLAQTASTWTSCSFNNVQFKQIGTTTYTAAAAVYLHNVVQCSFRNTRFEHVQVGVIGSLNGDVNPAETTLVSFISCVWIGISQFGVRNPGTEWSFIDSWFFATPTGAFAGIIQSDATYTVISLLLSGTHFTDSVVAGIAVNLAVVRGLTVSGGAIGGVPVAGQIGIQIANGESVSISGTYFAFLDNGVKYTTTGNGLSITGASLTTTTTPYVGFSVVANFFGSGNSGAGANNLFISSNKNVTFNNSMVLAAGADSNTYTFSSITGTIASLNTAQAWTNIQTYGDGNLVLNGATSGASTIKAAAVAGTTIINLPGFTTTLAGRDISQAWTAVQTFGAGNLVVNGATSGSTDIRAPTTGGGIATFFPGADTVAGLAATQALTNKTYNGNIWTAGTGTLTIAAGKTATHNASTTFAGTDGKTLTVSNSLSLAGTDATVMTFPTTSATLARIDAANTFTGTQTIGALVAATLNGNTFTTGTYTLTGTAAKTLNFTNSLTLSGTDATTMTFPSVSASIPGLAIANTFTAGQTISLSQAAQTALSISNTNVSTSASAGFVASSNSGTFTASANNNPNTTGQAGFTWTGASGMLFAATNASGPLIFDTGGFNERMRISAAGAMSVGTTTDPGAPGIILLSSYLQTGAVAVASLPTCGASTKGARHFATDANATFTAGIGAIVAAGGANNVPVTCDGTNWRIG